jgi:Tol biopolymer transport system component
MKVASAVPMMLVALGCGSDPGMIGPATQGEGTKPSLVSARYSDWSNPVNLGPAVNSASIEQGPFVSRDGLTLYFVSNRPDGFGSQDIYVSHRASLDEPWREPRNLGITINSNSNDASPTLSADEHRLYFHSGRPGGFGGTDLYVSRRRDNRDDFGWQAPENLGGIINTAANERGLTLLEDDETETTTVYFDSDRPGLGGVDTGVDIYASRLNPDGSFGPAALVGELSSASNDLLPGLRRDGLEIFLDSDRPGTLGLRDIWVSTRASTADPWSPPVNLTAVNSTVGDQRAALSFDGRSLYVASSRPGGLGGNDIYVSTRTKLGDGGDDDQE